MQAEGDTTVPELERVIVAVGEDVVIARSLQEALEELTDADLSELFTGLVVDSSIQNASSGGLGEVGEPADEDPLSLVTVPDDVAGLLVEIDHLDPAVGAEVDPIRLAQGQVAGGADALAQDIDGSSLAEQLFESQRLCLRIM